MATAEQKQAARRNLDRAREVQAARAHGKKVPRTKEGMSTTEKNHLEEPAFAFPDDRKEPLAMRLTSEMPSRASIRLRAESDADRDTAWRRILAAARKFNVTVSEGDWRELEGKGRADDH